ncbi:MAG TPA: FAD-dependent oxidoreductase [Nevskiaceae bacterium]
MVKNIKLLRRVQVAEGSMAFYFEKPAGFEFRAGQFGDLTLLNPPETDKEGDTRGFSIITAPYESDFGFATRMRNTAFKRVLKTLPIGTEVKLDAPYGDFRLHNTAATPAVFVIGGIGVTPVRSMIAQATHDKTAHKITLIHANRTQALAPFVADFEQLAKQNPNFKYVQVLEEPSAGWKGEKGRVNAEIIKRYVADLNAPIWYLSGPEGMVKAMRKLLVDLHANEDNIRTEEFAGY